MKHQITFVSIMSIAAIVAYMRGGFLDVVIILVTASVGYCIGKQL